MAFRDALVRLREAREKGSRGTPLANAIIVERVDLAELLDDWQRLDERVRAAHDVNAKTLPYALLEPGITELPYTASDVWRVTVSQAVSAKRIADALEAMAYGCNGFTGLLSPR